ncbi:hypothetical protein GCM10027217_40310 [Pseudomaricurvus hydrocarbonicus]
MGFAAERLMGRIAAASDEASAMPFVNYLVRFSRNLMLLNTFFKTLKSILPA